MDNREFNLFETAASGFEVPTHLSIQELLSAAMNLATNGIENKVEQYQLLVILTELEKRISILKSHFYLK